jgi:lipoate-protein ligase A
MRTPHLIIDRAAAGAWNMAVDEALVESATSRNQVTLRFYGWSEPTLSLGYFQAHAEREAHAASLACPLVRRSTGGGAIVHDRELTYSFTAPLGDRFSSSATELYSLLHGTLIEALADWNFAARFCGGPQAKHDAAEPFLCFQRRTEFDVLVGETKIAGSAQRRRRGAILQHGSVLLAASASAPEIPGLAEISGNCVDAAELAAAWVDRLARARGTTWNSSQLAADELAAVHQTAEQKYASPFWLYRR